MECFSVVNPVMKIWMEVCNYYVSAALMKPKRLKQFLVLCAKICLQLILMIVLVCLDTHIHTPTHTVQVPCEQPQSATSTCARGGQMRPPGPLAAPSII